MFVDIKVSIGREEAKCTFRCVQVQDFGGPLHFKTEWILPLLSFLCDKDTPEGCNTALGKMNELSMPLDWRPLATLPRMARQGKGATVSLCSFKLARQSSPQMHMVPV